MKLQLKAMDVIVRRFKPEEQCIQKNDYDNWFVQHIVHSTKCKPQYLNLAGNLSICKNAEQLMLIQNDIWDSFYGNTPATPPCTEIKFLDLEYDEYDNDNIDMANIDFYLVFRDTVYKEIRQVRAYTIKMLVADVGGYVGLLLGYALVKLPEFPVFLYGRAKEFLLKQE